MLLTLGIVLTTPSTSAQAVRMRARLRAVTAAIFGRTAADLVDATVTIGNATVCDRFCRVMGVARPFANSQLFANNLE